MDEKTKVLVHRLIWLVLLAVAVVLTALFAGGVLAVEMWWIYVLIMYDAVCVAFFIMALLTTYRAYEYDGNIMIVYAGFYYRYLKINGEVMDEHNTVMTFTAIQLSCTLDDGTVVTANITLTNRISLKINNRLYKNRVKI